MRKGQVLNTTPKSFVWIDSSIAIYWKSFRTNHSIY